MPGLFHNSTTTVNARLRSRMLLRELVDAHAAVRATSARNEKIARLAELLARVEPAETPAAVAWLSGELTQRQIGVGWAALKALPAAAAEPALTVAEVEDELTRVGGLRGPGSQAARREALAALFGRATEAEQRFLVALLLGDLGQGALAGVMTEAVAKAAGVPRDVLRRALMLRGDLGAVAAIAFADGRGRAGGGRARAAAARAADARAARRRTSTRRSSGSLPRPSTSSSTACACRSTGAARRCACSRARSTT